MHEINYKFNLYGPNFNLEKSKNINYHGVVSPEQLPNLLNSGFGLVWDGESIESCSGIFGNYLKYNNPHKLSLYLASGLPVIIWDKSAEAKFVNKNKVGITISSLRDIAEILNNFDEDRYIRLANNVKKISFNLTNGKYMSTALKEAMKKIKDL